MARVRRHTARGLTVVTGQTVGLVQPVARGGPNGRVNPEACGAAISLFDR